MKQRDDRWVVIVEHVTDTEAAADIARAFDIILRAADRAQGEPLVGDHRPARHSPVPADESARGHE